ncbi:MAG: hypothetical protein AAFN74_17835 [Myxococcota bacterium]
MTARVVATVFGLLAASTGPAFAGGWTQAKGAYYVKVWDRTLIGREVFVTERTTARLQDSFQDHQINVYAEYGLTEDFTLTLNGTGLGLAIFGDEQRLYSGGGALGLRYGLAKGNLPIAVEVQLGARPSSGSLATGSVEFNRSGAIETELFDAAPSVGTGHGSLELQGGFGLPFLWMAGSAGLRGFTNGQLKPAFYIKTQIGWISAFGLVLDLHMNWYHATGAIGPINVYGAAQTRYLGFGLGASYWLTEHIGINAGFDGVFFATANAATPALLLGMEFK